MQLNNAKPINRHEPAVRVEQLTRTFGEFTAVDRITLEVKRGEVFGFLGPNGAGKSTTIRMLCGLLMPTGGGGTVSGFDILTRSEDIKKNIGYMSQKFSLYDDLTVEENINFFGGIYLVAKDRFDERKEWVLGMAGLAGDRARITGSLPGGYKQRLALGCALLHEPPILFLDEPTSGVDPLSRRAFWRLIYELSRSGTTVFVTTHYMDEADYCDRLALIYRGSIIAEGTPAELRREHMKMQVFEIETGNAVRALEILLANGIESAIFGSLIHATVNEGKDGPERIRFLLANEGIPPTKVERIIPSLEDVFVTLIETSSERNQRPSEASGRAL